MPRPAKVTPSRPTPRPSTRSQQPSPGPHRSKAFLNILKQQQSNHAGTRGDTSDNDNESVCSSSKSSEVILARTVMKGKAKDESGAIKAPWRHPDELDYFRPYDWTEDKIISQLRATVFTVPPPVNGKQSFIEITLYDDGEFDKPRPIKVPRGYRVPLMFVAKFQWASLRLVLTSAQREKEWSDYKFDILHLSRLCERFFSEALKACNNGIVDIPPMKTRATEFQVADGVMSRKWRCPTFDRALARYNKNWLISREEFLRDFYIEFENEEYEKDVLKIDWSRWALKGHKGFKLTQDELKNGIDARMITRGLKKDDGGKWIWVDDYVIKQEEVAAAVVPSITEEVVTTSPTTTSKRVGTAVSAPRQDSEPKPQPHGGSSTPEPASATSTTQINDKVSVTPPAKPSRQPSSEAPSVRTAKQPSPFVEKFHSPLSSLPSSSSPSEAPVSHTETTAANTAQAVPQKSPKPKSTPPPNTARSPEALKLTPLVISSVAPEAIPQSTPASEGTQPPGSRSPPFASSPEQRAQSVEAVASSPSPLTPVHPDTFFSEPTQELILEPEMEEVKPIIVPDRRLTPTSIDSTPNPSPAILPKDAEKPTQRVEFVPEIPSITPTGLDPPGPQASRTPRKSGFVLSPRYFTFFGPLVEDGGIVTRAKEASPRPTPYGPPHPPLPTGKEVHGNINPNLEEPSERTAQETLRTPQPPKTPAQCRSPVFLSPLLPPTNPSRSPSLDEIPGLGGPLSRQPLCLPPQFVVPKMTARTVTTGSSWLMMESGSSSQIRSLKIEPQEPDLLLMEDVQMHKNEEIPCIGRDTHMQSPERSAEPSQALEQPMMPNVDNSQVTPAQSPSVPTGNSPAASAPIAQNRNQSGAPPSEDDDDSDMDFGTPVTSPAIIVPGPKLENIEMLPPPKSPSTPQEHTPRNRMSPSLISTTSKTVSSTSVADGALNIIRFQGPESAGPTKTISKPANVLPTGRAESSTNIENPIGTSAKGLLLNATLASARGPPNRDSRPSTALGTLSPVHQTHPPQSSPPSLSCSVPAAGSTSSQNQLASPFNVQVQPTQFNNVNGHAFAFTSPRNSTIVPPSMEPRLNGPVTLILEPQKYSGSSINIPVHHQVNQLDPTPRGGPSRSRLLPLQSQPTILDGTVTQVPAESTPCRDQRSDMTSPTRSFLGGVQQDNSLHEMVLSQPIAVSRKRQREDEDEDENEDEDEIAFKSRKRGEGLSIREGGIVVRKVVSMVRDTLTGLNDLLEIAAENELIPSERMRGRNKGKARALETPASRESPLYTPVSPSPVVQAPIRPHAADTSDITRFSEEIKSMRAEMAQLKEKNIASESSVENEHVREMRAELEALREQVRILKEAKANPEQPEVQVMKNELLSLRNEMRSLQDTSRRPSVPSVSSTPSTPNLTLRINNHTMANTVHPLAHLLAVEHDTTPSSPAAAAASSIRSAPIQTDGDIIHSGPSHASSPAPREEAEKRPDPAVSTPHPPAIFDDISLPVKSKRKARNIFSRS